MSAAQQVITIDDISADNAPVIYVAGGLDQFYSAVEKEVTGEVPDLKTAKGRARIASLAAKVSSSKVAVEKPGRDYLKKLKEMPKQIEVELAAWVKKMDALRDKTREPLTAWEAAEVARRDVHTDGIQRIKDLAVFAETPTAAFVAQVIANLELVAIDDDWDEFVSEAAQAKDKSLITLRALLADRTKHEAELAEIAKFNAEKAEREQKERDAEITRKAVEQARIDAEEKAKAERDASARREQELKDQAAAQQRAADQKIRDAEAEAERQTLQIKLQAEQAERQKLQAEQDRVSAEQRQAAAVEQARLDEIARREQATAEERRQAELREADKAHKAKVNRAALQAFIDGGMPEDCAKKAVILIASRHIPAVSITY